MSRLTIDIPTGLGRENCRAAERTDSVRQTASARPGMPARPIDGRGCESPVDHPTDSDENATVDEPVRAFVSWVECWAGA